MNQKTPSVSVITPFYNEEEFIEETIQSVIKQQYENWELILVDDGSIDNSTNVAKEYASSYADQIRYIEHANHSNRGASASRNLGIKHAKGKLIAFLDADDIFEPNYLDNQVKNFNNTKATMVCEATVYWNSWYNEQKDDEMKLIGVPQNQLYKPGELSVKLYPLKKGSAAPCMCGIIVLKDAVKKYGGFVDSFHSNYTDQVFLSKMYYHEPVYISSSCNNHYRQRDDSASAKIKDNTSYIKIRTEFLEWFKGYLEQCDSKNSEVYKLIKKNLLPYTHPIYHKIFYALPRRILNKIRRVFTSQ
ncbi:glycosyltransferase family 2 protein [Rhodohalobacter sp. SW132]|uniref:glycosyltransferase family 2 protein n=1 Tax=Rhodohalobacter sp. SW132 TaxID=2293433 RepID=UPI000E27AA65|nr:glycosyltransferase family 2 protein [Rhodohalobacter sp. SW132]REL24167.1 glycosyltransferase family 2 protein [Rhodohalobacter sp. SW132]